jgi:hypothetical protein
MTEYSKLFAVHTDSHLRTLGSWNIERRAYWDAVRDRIQHPERYLNGLKCPSCLNGNLYDTGQATAGHPVKLRVKCISCNHKDERYE